MSTQPDTTITVGDRVRSFHFDGRDLTGDRACYVEGVVVGFTDERLHGCSRYVIEVDREIFGGEVVTGGPEKVHPPVNGTPKLFGGVSDNVVRIER